MRAGSDTFKSSTSTSSKKSKYSKDEQNKAIKGWIKDEHRKKNLLAAYKEKLAALESDNSDNE
jgi:hypothetical protein